jgi:hypothetical protein
MVEMWKLRKIKEKKSRGFILEEKAKVYLVDLVGYVE